MSNKAANIGTRQLYKICNMKYEAAFELLSQGLSILFESAQDCFDSANLLKNKPRSRAVLMGQAGEEATKILMLLDAIRCPKKRLSKEARKICASFYNHVSRLAYDEVLSLRPLSMKDLRDYIKPNLESHYLDGNHGEYIYPNMRIHNRESALYGDVIIVDDRAPTWTSPLDPKLYRYSRTPDSLMLCQSLNQFGLLSESGAKIIADVWGKYDFTDALGHKESDACIQETLERAKKQKLPLPTASDDDVRTLYRFWQFPMYDLDLRPVNRSLEDLREEQRVMLAFEMGQYD